MLPNIIQFPPGEGNDNLAPTAVLGSAGLAWFGSALGYGLTAIGVVASVRAGLRRDWLAAVSGAVMALLFVSGTIWNHYLVATVVVSAAAWPRAAAHTKLLIVAFLAMNSASSIVPELNRPVWLLTIIGVSLATSLGGPARGAQVPNGAT